MICEGNITYRYNNTLEIKIILFVINYLAQIYIFQYIKFEYKAKIISRKIMRFLLTNLNK